MRAVLELVAHSGVSDGAARLQAAVTAALLVRSRNPRRRVPARPAARTSIDSNRLSWRHRASAGAAAPYARVPLVPAGAVPTMPAGTMLALITEYRLTLRQRRYYDHPELAARGDDIAPLASQPPARRSLAALAAHGTTSTGR